MLQHKETLWLALRALSNGTAEAVGGLVTWIFFGWWCERCVSSMRGYDTALAVAVAVAVALS
jgi:hypothetical protein